MQNQAQREDLCSIFLHKIIVRYVKEQRHFSSTFGVLPCLLHQFCMSVDAVIPCQIPSHVVDDKVRQLGLKNSIHYTKVECLQSCDRFSYIQLTSIGLRML